MKYALIIVLVVLSFSSTKAFGQNVVHDHIPSSSWGDPSAWPYGSTSSLRGQFEDPSGVTSEIYWNNSGFRGDGNNLHSYTIRLTKLTYGLMPWDDLSFDVRFWQSEARLLADPELQNPLPGDRFLTVTSPSNPGWDTPIDYVEFGGPDRRIYLYELTFDLTPHSISTVAGGVHFMSVVPVGPLAPISQLDSPLFTPGATGGPGDVGAETVWSYEAGLLYPSGAPYPYLSDRIMTVPSPGGAMLLLLGAVPLTRHQRR